MYPLDVMGDPSDLLAGLGLSGNLLRLVGGIAALSGSVEFWSERAIWHLEGVPLSGTRPWTDGQPISKLIKRLADLGAGHGEVELSRLLTLWCEVAIPAFQCRNSILHGVTTRYGDEAATFIRGARWDEVVRPPAATSMFYADERTLSLLQAVFGTLLRGIYMVDRAASGEEAVESSRLRPALTTARSIAFELVDLAGAVNHEKY